MIINNQAFISLITRKINQISEEILQRFLTKKQFHDAIQRKIVEMANSFNLRGLREYHVQNVRTDGRSGSIDVIWMANLGPVAVFEIDSFPRSKSIKKLLLIDALFRFWVCYGSKDPLSLIRKYDTNNLVQVIRLKNIHFSKKRQKN